MGFGLVPLVWRRPAVDWAVIGVLLLGAWAISFALGGSRTVGPHAFYLPVLVAAFRRGAVGTTISAGLAGLAAGPLLPLDVAAATMQPWPNWTARMGAFLVVGLVTAGMAGRLQAIRSMERDFAEERKTILQLVDHELRSPLTVLKTSTTLLGQATLPDRVGSLVAPMHNAVDRLESLAVMVAATLANDDERESLVRVMVGTVLASVLIDLPRDQRARVNVAGDSVTVTTFRRPLKTALACLLDNALRFSPADQPVHVSVQSDDEGCRIAIRDFGPGIPPDQVLRLLEPFQQGDASATRERGGLGLGLFAAYRSVQICGGALRLEGTDEGHGMTAVIQIPMQVTARSSTG